MQQGKKHAVRILYVLQEWRDHTPPQKTGGTIVPPVSKFIFFFVPIILQNKIDILGQRTAVIICQSPELSRTSLSMVMLIFFNGFFQ